MRSDHRPFRPIQRAAGLVLAVTLLLAGAPAATAQEPMDVVDGFAVVSATVDVATGFATVTYTFHCIGPIEYVRIRSTLTQRHAGVEDFASSSVTAAEFACAAGTTVTLPVSYGGQQGSYHAGPADIVTNLYAYEGTYTVDSASVVGGVLLHPSHP
jgi:hypothetical protein